MSQVQVIIAPAGASLWSLAQAYYSDGAQWPLLAQANPQITNPNIIIAGQRVNIPPKPGPRDLAAKVAVALATAMTLAGALAYLSVPFIQAGIQRASLSRVLEIVMAHPPQLAGIAGSASGQVGQVNLARIAGFVVTSATRLDKAIADARSRDEDADAAAAKAVAAEKRYFAQHLDAIWNRARAGAAVDSAAMSHGDLLGWNAVNDKRTTAECRDANGKNFRASAMPAIGFPGMVHNRCRCWPSAPHRGAAVIPGATISP